MELRPYQIEDVAWLVSKGTGLILNEQRTGKTPTSLVAMAEVNKGRTLVITTASMVYRWAKEITAWTGRNAYVYAGKKREEALNQFFQDTTSFMVVSYDLFKTTKVSNGLIDSLGKHMPEGLIVDEAHRCTRQSKSFASIKRLSYKVPYRFYLTGTPAPNHPSQVWTLLHMLNPKYYTSYWSFVAGFFDVVTVTQGCNEFKDVRALKEETKEVFVNVLNSHAVMRKRKDVMPWLRELDFPDKYYIPATPAQVKYITNMMKYFEAGDVFAQGVLDQLLRVRQLILAPELLGLTGSSPKIDWLCTFHKDYPEKQLVVFSRFTQFLKLIEKELCGVGKLLVGETPLTERTTLIDDFQSGKIKVLLIQIDAGKEGLTLDAADAIIFTDVFPPVGDILQAKDRIVATTPERVKPQEYIQLVLENTYDEVLYDMVERNVQMTDVVNSFVYYMKGV